MVWRSVLYKHTGLAERTKVLDNVWHLYYTIRVKPIYPIGILFKERAVAKRTAGISMRKTLLFCITMMMGMLLIGCGSGNRTGEGGSAGDVLTVPLSSLSAEPLFVDWEQDGQPMQLIALRDGEEVRVAYNTCQSCAGSPYAYYEYENGILTCQNCGFTFRLDAVGAVAGGCNPKPVEDYTVTENSLEIGADELRSAMPDFKTWKKFA